MEAPPNNDEPDEPLADRERLSRLETIVSRAEFANELAHEHFRSEDTMILKAQMALNDSQRALNDAMAKMAGSLELFAKESRREDRKLRLRMRETTEKLDALIKIVDGSSTRTGVLNERLQG